jgi:hypothetical protein
MDAPIPGQSLVGEIGSKPWEQPPKLNTVDEAVEHYLPMFKDKEIIGGILSHIEAGIPLTTMADLITKGGVMTGLHTIDVSMLVAPVLVELMVSVAEAAEIEYTIGTEVKEKSGPTETSMEAAIAALNIDDEDTIEEEELLEEPVEDPMDTSLGMMARRGV